MSLSAAVFTRALAPSDFGIASIIFPSSSQTDSWSFLWSNCPWSGFCYPSQADYVVLEQDSRRPTNQLDYVLEQVYVQYLIPLDQDLIYKWNINLLTTEYSAFCIVNPKHKHDTMSTFFDPLYFMCVRTCVW